MPKANTINDIWRRVDKSAGENNCWPYQGAKSHFGHGAFSIKERPFQAHRVAYEATHGPIPPGLWVLHMCDNPPCCNPKHLKLGTPKQNTHDMITKGRAKWGVIPAQKGSKNKAAKLTEKQVIEMRKLHVQEIVSLIRLRDIFNVSYSTVVRIISRESWTHI